MLLLTIKPEPVWIWRECSLFGLLFQIPGAIIAFRNARNLTSEEKKHTSKTLLYGVGAMGGLTLLFQVFNIAVLNQFWPFFLSIVMHLMAGLLQFTRMVLLLPPAE
jgi:hypothetical protein